MHRTPLARTAVLAVLVAGLAACGGHGTSAAKRGTGRGATGSAGPVTTAGGQAGGGSFCNLALQIREEAPFATAAAQSPTAFRTEAQRFLALEPALRRVAPAPIAAPLHALLAYDGRVFRRLAAVRYDLAELGSAEEATLAAEATALKPDQVAVSRYLSSTCGISTPAT